MKRYFLPELFSGLLILLFMYTSINKFARLDGFEEVLSKSPLLGRFSFAFAIGIPTLEILIALFLFFPKTRKTGFLWSLVLMLLFTAYIGGMLLFSSKLPCSCGGVLSELSWKQHLVFNIFFVAVAAGGLLVSGRPDPPVSSANAHG